MGKTLGKVAMVVGGIALIATGAGAIFGTAAVTAALGGISAAMLTTAAGVLSLGASMLTKQTPPKVSAANADRLQISLNPRAPRVMAFGSTALATDIRDQEFTGADKDYLHRWVVVAAHRVEAIRELWFDDKLAWSSTGGVQGEFVGYLTVTPVLEGSAGNVQNISSRMGTSRRFTGCAYLHLRYKLTGNGTKKKPAESPFASQVPSRVTIVGDGIPCYDPRQDSTVPGGSGAHRANDQTTWTWGPHCRNPPIQLGTYLLGWRINGKLSVGKGIQPNRIDWPSFITGANLCSEPIAKVGGGTEPRYLSDGLFNESDAPLGVVDSFKAAMNADLDDQDGLIRLTVFHNDLASFIDLSTPDVLGEYKWLQTPPLSDQFNIVRGTFVDTSPNALYQPNEYKEVSVASRDGIDRLFTADYGLVQSKSQAERLSKQRLQRQLYGGTFTAQFQATAWRVQKGSVVRFNFTPEGFVNKLFRVVEATTQIDGIVPMTLREEHAAIYAWDKEEGPAVVHAVPTEYAPGDTPVVQFLNTVEAGADVTADHTAANVAMVGSRTAEAVNLDIDQAKQDAADALAASGGGDTQQTIDDILVRVDDLETTYGSTASAAASASAAAAHESNSLTARDVATGARDAAIAARDLAASYRDAAGGHSTTASGASVTAVSARDASRKAATNAGPRSIAEGIEYFYDILNNFGPVLTSHGTVVLRNKAAGANLNATPKHSIKQVPGRTYRAHGSFRTEAGTAYPSTLNPVSFARGAVPDAMTHTIASQNTFNRVTTVEANFPNYTRQSVDFTSTDALQMGFITAYFTTSFGATYPDTVIELRDLWIEDITDRKASADSASAAAGSATQAGTSESNAGQSATAAAQSATNANTFAGNAETFRNQASSSASGAAGSASTAAEQAGVSAVARDVAKAAASIARPSTLDATGTGFTDAFYTAANTEPPDLLPAQITVQNGRYAFKVTGPYHTLMQKGVFRPQAGRVYEVAVHWLIKSVPTDKYILLGAGLNGYGENFAYSYSVASNWTAYFTNPANAPVTYPQEHVSRVRFTRLATAAQEAAGIVSIADVHVHSRPISWNTADQSDAEYYVLGITLTDVTSEVAAGGHASAAATSSSTATASKNAAGESASAAAGSATTAQTSAGTAGTHATNASTSATNAAGSENRAATSAKVAVASGAVLFPNDFQQDGRFFSALQGNPLDTVPFGEGDTNVIYENVDGIGRTMRFRGTGYVHMRTRALIKTVPNRTYEITARVRQHTGGATSTSVHLQWYGLGSDFQTIYYSGYGTVPDHPSGNPSAVTLGTSGTGWFDLATQITTPASFAAGIAWVVPDVYLYAVGSGMTGWVELSHFTVRDVTEARAAAGFASTASTHATNAGNSATAANTSSVSAASSAASAGGAASTRMGSPALAPTLWGYEEWDSYAPNNRLVPSGNAGLFQISGSKLIIKGGVHIHPAAPVPLVAGRRYRVRYVVNVVSYGSAINDVVSVYLPQWRADGSLARGAGSQLLRNHHSSGLPVGLHSLETMSFGLNAGADANVHADTAFVRQMIRILWNAGTVIELLSCEIVDVDAMERADASATAAAGSASTASTKADAAGASATAANTSATNASTSAGTASTKAGEASTSATGAAGSASSAATHSSTAATHAIDSGKAAVSGNVSPGYTPRLFAVERWYSFTPDTTLLDVIGTDGHLIENNVLRVTGPRNRRVHIHPKAPTPIVPGRKYRMRYTVGRTVKADNNDELVDAYVMTFNGDTAHLENWHFKTDRNNLGVGTHTFESPVYGVAAGASGYDMATDRKWGRPCVVFQSYGGSDLQFISMEVVDVTEREAAAVSAAGASASATAAANSSTTASGHAATAFSHATLAANIAGASVIRNGSWVDWPAGQSRPNGGWMDWIAGYAPYLEKGAGLISANCVRINNIPAHGVQHYIGMWQRIHDLNPGYWVLEADVKLISGTFGASGISMGINDKDINPRANSAAVAAPTLRFDIDKDISGVVPSGTAADFRMWRFRKLIRIEHAQAAVFDIYVMGNYGGGNWGGPVQKEMEFHRVALRPASDAEASVVTAAGAIADLKGRSLAYWQVETVAGLGNGATAFISARAETAPGTVSSTVSFGAREVLVYNPASGTAGAWVRTLTVTGGEVTINGSLTANAGIFLGSGVKWQVALQSRQFNVSNGTAVAYGVNLGNIPVVDFSTVGLAPLNAGETYRLRATSSTPTGFTASLEIITPGTTGSVTTTGPGTASDLAPTSRQLQNPHGDATNQIYRIRVQGTHTMTAYYEYDGNPGFVDTR